jgi:hypothetical protein
MRNTQYSIITYSLLWIVAVRDTDGKLPRDIVNMVQPKRQKFMASEPLKRHTTHRCFPSSIPTDFHDLSMKAGTRARQPIRVESSLAASAFGLPHVNLDTFNSTSSSISH